MIKEKRRKRVYKMTSSDRSSDGKLLFVRSLLSGAMAGFSVDVSLYPLDTIKTRLYVLLF